jgi:membrane-associated phospholipid phosphatase
MVKDENSAGSLHFDPRSPAVAGASGCSLGCHIAECPRRHDAAAHPCVAGVMVAALGFSIWSVRSGRWAHVDASNPVERRSLNWFLSVSLMIASAISWHDPAAHELAFGFLVCGVAVVVALALSPVLKISLHTCFAAVAAGLLWPNQILVAAGLCVVAALAWSRLVLHRHTIAEVVLGAVVGVGSAVGYHALVS